MKADPALLAPCLEHLLANAVEHGSTSSAGPARPGDGDAVEGRGGRPEAGPVAVTVGGMDRGFYVADDGTGVPESERDRVFEPGFSSTERGTGLGLGIVRQVADAHGWSVRVTDGEDGGARFEVRNVDTVE